jgi:hypothetical protein
MARSIIPADRIRESSIPNQKKDRHKHDRCPRGYRSGIAQDLLAREPNIVHEPLRRVQLQASLSHAPRVRHSPP